MSATTGLCVNVIDPYGTGASNVYVLCVWPVQMADTAADVLFTMSANSPPLASSVARSTVGLSESTAPAWYALDLRVVVSE